MGDNRGGLYGYDFLDRFFGFLARPTSTKLLPEFQKLSVGDKILMGPEELTVSKIEPERILVLSYQARGLDWIWQFGLYPVDEEHTRLVSRGTERASNPAARVLLHLMEPPAFLMTTRMLLNLKARAEGLRATAA
jgi:hypothetical protein